jgi:hypothetical protein
VIAELARWIWRLLLAGWWWAALVEAQRWACLMRDFPVENRGNRESF